MPTKSTKASKAAKGGLNKKQLTHLEKRLLEERARVIKELGHYGESFNSSLQASDGVVLGMFGGRYLRHDGPEHVMAFAPTRSGKGVGLVVPTLLTWPESAVIHDIKGELWQLTAGYRSRFSHCLLLNPTDSRSAAYNPLLEVRRGAEEVRDAQNIADILVDPEGMLERRNHWEKTSHSLLVAAILHVNLTRPPCRAPHNAGAPREFRGVSSWHPGCS